MFKVFWNVLELIGCFVGWLTALSIGLLLMTFSASAGVTVTESLPFITISMLFATLIGAIGGYLAFGEDKKFPPSATSVGHILLGFGAGLFFSRGSLELMGHLESSDNVVVLASFLWAVAGYFFLRLVVSTVQSDVVSSLLPEWLNRILGGRIK